MANPASTVAAVIVTYQPEEHAIAALLDALLDQVDSTILIDNGSGANEVSWLRELSHSKLSAIFLEQNLGLAAAQNLGIDQARSLGAEFVLFSDQDSLPAPDMVQRLLSVARARLAEGCRLAAVGPRYFDAHQQSLRPFVRVRGLQVQRLDCQHADQIIEVDHLISSGSLIPMSALDAIGEMREELFIDYVDTEWSLRAWRMGFRSFGVCNASMRHGLGDRPYRLFGRYVPIHSPARHYYLFRNTIWLYRQGWIPWTWKLATARRVVLVFLFFAILSNERLSHVRMMLRGLKDGFLGRMGRYEA